MHKMISQIIQWKDKLLRDVALTIIEAIVALLIAYLYLIVLSMDYGLNTEGVGFLDAVTYTVTSTLRPTEMIIYVAGVLSSTTAYFIVRLMFIKTSIKRLYLILFLTVILLLIAIALYTSGLQSTPVNRSFATGIAKVVGCVALGIWLFSIFCQRRIFEREYTFSGDRRGIEIARNLGST